MKKATIREVAKLAGVSIKTVSRVVNREANVRPATRQKVTDAINLLDYRPNILARGLAGNRSFLLGLLYDNPSDSYVTKIQNGVLRACRKYTLDLLIHPCDYENPDLLDEIGGFLRATRVDGLVLTPPLSDMRELCRSLDELDLPYVLISPGSKVRNQWSVGTNDRSICAHVVSYLAQLGHRRIAFIMGHPDHGAIARRYEGFLQGMHSEKLKVQKSMCVQGFNSFDSGVDCGHKLLRRKRRPTAIFASNDDMAAGVLKAAHELGIAVPAELSVVGFDDIPLASQVWPPLTTIRQPIGRMAEAAADLLVERMDGAQGPVGIRELPSEFVVRESSGAVPSD